MKSWRRLLRLRQCPREVTIEQWNARQPYELCDEVLVVTFGSTPLVTRSSQAAMQLATYCRQYGPPPGLCWINACSAGHVSAVEFARRRDFDEALAGHPPRIPTMTSTIALRPRSSVVANWFVAQLRKEYRYKLDL
jgi:hypothetical protein